MVAEISGLTDSLLAERTRSLRLMKRKRGLELDVVQAKENARAEIIAERTKWEKRVSELETQLSERKEMLRVVQESVVAIETKEREAVGKFREQLELNSSLEVKLEESATSLMGVEKTLAEMQKQNDDLRATLNSLPSRDVIISEFLSSDVHEKELSEARAAGVISYKASEEFGREMDVLSENAVKTYKESADYAASIKELKSVWASEYSKSIAFRQAVGMEAGKMSKHVVECCREFLKDDLRRPGHEFGDFFMSFVQQRLRSETGASSLGSVCKSST